MKMFNKYKFIVSITYFFHELQKKIYYLYTFPSTNCNDLVVLIVGKI